MRAVILVGGEGTRLRPLTYTTPKAMLPVVEVPMIERIVGHLVRNGVTDVVLSLGYQPEAFTAAYPDNRCAGASLSYVVEREPLDTAGAVRFAAERSAVAETFLVINGDVLTDLDVNALVAFHRDCGAEATISLTPVEDPSTFGVVSCAADGRVEAFIEKPSPGTAPTNLINAGTYVLEPSVLNRIADGRPVNIEREVFPSMVADGRLFALATTDYWLDVGTPERYLRACADLLSGARPGPPAPGAVEVTPHVFHVGAVNDGAVDSGAVAGPSLLADGVAVAEGASVSGCVLSTGVRVGHGAVIERSVILAGACVGAGAGVEDSIVGPGALIGEGAHLSSGAVVGADARIEAGALLVGSRRPG